MNTSIDSIYINVQYAYITKQKVNNTGKLIIPEYNIIFECSRNLYYEFLLAAISHSHHKTGYLKQGQQLFINFKYKSAPSTVNMQFKNMQQVENYAHLNNRLLVVYDTHVLDVTTFATHHPGGASLITNLNNKDITKDMDGHFPLSLQLADTLAIGSLKKQILTYINTNQPLLPQIWNTNHQQYLKIVHLPHWVFQQSPRMFQSEIVQKLSYCSWYNIFFVPYIWLFYYYKTKVEAEWTDTTLLQGLALFFSGMFLFSFTEYILHRFVFHSEKRLFDNRALRYLHFISHGIHHMFPFDPYRLVLPPAFTAIAITLLYQTFYRFMYWQNRTYNLIFYTGFLTGYIMYDLIHYMIHHVKLKKGIIHNIFKKIEKHHNQHHFGGQQRGYGVSSPLWDYIFGTTYRNKRGE